MYPEIVDTDFKVLRINEVKCILPCYGSKECNCLSDWDVILMNDRCKVCSVIKHYGTETGSGKLMHVSLDWHVHHENKSF